MISSMKQIKNPSAFVAPVGSEGGRSPSAPSTGEAPTTPAMVPGTTATPATAPPKAGPLAPGQHRVLRRHAAHRRAQHAQHGERVAPGQDGPARPFGPAEIALIAKATFPTSSQHCGIRRVCRV
jgi:hypothetical protein